MSTSFRDRVSRPGLTFIVLAALALPLVLAYGMTTGLNHDEHQHIAVGALVARAGRWPYEGFPMFHTPYLAFIYAALFGLSDHLLLVARWFSVGCSTGTVALLGTVAYHLFEERGKRYALGICVGTVLLVLTCTVFEETSGHAWNHQPSLLLVLLAACAHRAGILRDRNRYLVLSGVLLGLGIGTRITYAPLLAPFGLMLFGYSRAKGWKWSTYLSFCLGTLAGLAGFLWLLAKAPEQAYFGTFGFAQINLDFRHGTGRLRSMTWLTKLVYCFKIVVAQNAGLLAAAVFPGVGLWRVRRTTRRPLPLELRFLLLVLPFLLMGSMAPTPLYRHYFFPFVPFLILTGLYCLTEIPVASNIHRRVIVVLGIGLVVTVGTGLEPCRCLGQLGTPDEWLPNRIHEQGAELRAFVKKGRILTLAPIYPLEAGLEIYPEFSTAPFGWRVAPFIEPTRARRLVMVTPETLEGMLAEKPPAGVLVGFAEPKEGQLSDYPSTHGYHAVEFEEKRRLWVRGE